VKPGESSEPYTSLSSTLVFPDPLARHHIATRRTRHKVPRLVGKKSLLLLPPHDANEDQPEPHGQKRVLERSAALLLW
jgi:hypothetical protein